MSSRLSRNTLILLTSNGGNAVLSFILSVLIGRVLGEDGLGVYSTALAWVFPLSLVAEFGLGTLMTRDLAQDPTLTSAYLTATAIPRLWIGGLLTSALILLAPILSGDPSVVMGLRISAPLIIMLPTFGAFTAVFRARQVMWPIPPLNLGMLVAQVVLTALVFAAGYGVLVALAVNTLTSAGQLIAAWVIYRAYFRVPATGAFDLPLRTRGGGRGEGLASIRTLLRRAIPFALAALLAAVQARIGTILLERLTDTGEVGYYAAASRFVEAGRMIPNALFGALFPALAALALQPAELSRTFRRVLAGLSAFGLALGILFTPLAAFAISFTYGAAFAPAAPVLQIAMWGLLPGLLRVGWTLYWYALGREGLTNRVTAIALLAHIALSLWLIPSYGAWGVACALLLSEILALVLLWLPGLRAKPNA